MPQLSVLLLLLSALPFSVRSYATGETNNATQTRRTVTEIHLICVRSFNLMVDVDPLRERKYLDDILVKREGQDKATGYARTNRGLHDFFRAFPDTYPKHWYTDSELKGHRILDGATGDGKFVSDLDDMQIQAEGFDIAVTRKMLDDPRKIFFAADFLKIPRKDGSYNRIYLHHGPFEYCEESPAFYRAAFLEMKRVLEIGGKIRIIPIKKPWLLNEVLEGIPGLEITERPPPDWKGAKYLEITRIN